MKKAIMFTMGTRGDVQPYIFLAQALQQADMDVTLGSHPCWEKLVSEAGVKFAPIGPDIDIELEAAKIRGKEKNAMMAMLKTMQFVFKIVEQSAAEVYECCKGKDLVIVSHSHIGAAEAEALHIKTVDVTLQTEMLPEITKPRTFLQRISNGLFGMMINPMIMKPYNKLRKSYGLSKVKSMDLMMSPELNLIPISKYVIEPNPYWAPQNKMVGYWYEEQTSDYEPSQELKDFLQAGEPPIILALGAMSFEAGEEREKLEIFLQAFTKSKKRAIIQGFRKTLQGYNLPETMIAVGSVPHSWLFRQGCCVIHHGGFGTSASAMLYGVPSIIIPHALDQFGVADRLYKLGVTTEPIKASELCEEKLLDRIEYLDRNYTVISDRVKSLSAKMSEEHGLDTAVQMIQEVIRTRNDESLEVIELTNDRYRKRLFLEVIARR